MTGTFEVRSTQGDCATATMTKIHETGNSTLHWFGSLRRGRMVVASRWRTTGR